MSDTTVTVEVIGTEKLIAKFDGYVGRLRGELKTAMQKTVNYLVAYCKENKLSGQVLHRRTGTLSRSIKGNTDDEPAQIVGTVTSRDKGNAPLKYARYWELGFVGQETVREHVRKTASGGFATVRQFIRNVNTPARPYLKPTRDENVDYVRTTIKAAVTKVNAT